MPEFLYVDVKASGLKLVLILLNKPFEPVNRNQNFVLSSSRIDFKKVFNFDTRIKTITPDTLYFSEKTGFQKIVPVKVPLFIKCREGYGYRRPVINPNFITIWGDTNIIGSIDTIYTQPLTLNNVSQNVSSNVSFIRPDPEVYTSVANTHIFIEVARLVEQTVTLPLSDVNNDPRQQVNIYPSSVRVRFTSMQNAFAEGDTSIFKARIDSRKINKRTKKCSVFLSTVPGNVTIMEVEPKEVEILIFKR